MTAEEKLRELCAGYDKPLWVSWKYIATDGLEHTETYDFATKEYSEEWHPKT